jgi:Adenine specific DNA methylase Mod
MKTKLELTWIGKENRPRLEPRILIEDSAKSQHAPFRVGKNDFFDNRLIFGDNLLALKALEQEFAEKIKCVFIDPPYNTGSAFEHYDDGIEHSLWLSLMRDRIELLRNLLTKEGSLWITIDDTESHYLKVVCDEIFGRKNFVANVVWQKKYTIANDAKWLSDNHDHVLLFAKDKDLWRPNPIPRTDEMNARYRNPDNHPKGVWKATPLHAKSGSEANKGFTYTFNNGVKWSPPPGTYPRFSAESLRRLNENNEIWFGRDGKATPSRKTFLLEVASGGTPSATVWLQGEVGNNHEARDEVKAINPSDPFATPKPERLLQRIFTLGTNPGDLVLDSFAGSGTTGAVAHKMGRRWIMVELGEHCHTHIIPRLKKVIEGKDPGGITKVVGWKGGGGFRYYRLAPSLLEKDQFDNWVINRKFNPAMLAEAMCKLEGFTYAPSDTFYWLHGHSTETDFIYVTTQTLTREQLQKLSDEVGEGRSLLVMCGAFRVKNLTEFPNLTIKKIPKTVLNRCEWGKDDYSLEIKNLPMKSSDDEEESKTTLSGQRQRSKEERRAQAQPTLFDMPVEKGGAK